MNRHLPSLRLTPPSEYQRQCLAAWLREWAIDVALRQTPTAPDQADVEPPSAESREVAVPQAEPAARPTEPVAGQIRLLHPVSAVPSLSRPIYIALLVETGSPTDAFLAAPFSRFAEPAGPGEWRTGIRAMPLRILCLWNARLLPRSVVLQSWSAGRLSPAGIRQAMDVDRHLRTGAPLGSASARRVGPPVVHPLDPRLRYEAEEAETFECAVRSLQECAAVRPAHAVYDTPPKIWLKAAEARAPYVAPRKRRRRGSPPHLA